MGAQTHSQTRRPPMTAKCCGTCKWHECEMDDSWICVNNDSEFCADWTPYDHFCEEWEGR